MRPDDNFKILNCQCIECPDPFIIMLHDGQVDAASVDDIRQFGQTIPLLVWQQTDDRYRLLGDYPTFQVITSLGIERVICRVLPAPTPPFHRYSLQILHKISLGQVSPILDAHLLQQAQQHLDDRMLLSLLPKMGYKPQRFTLDELTTLLRLSHAAILAVHRGVLSYKTGKMMKLLSYEDQDAIVGLVQAFRPGGSKQIKLIEMISELSLRETKPVHKIIQDCLPAEYEIVAQDNAPQKLQALLQSLSVRCWPERTMMAKRFQRLVEELHLPDGVSLTPNLSFEDESVEMHLRFANTQILQKKWEQIRLILS